VISILKIMKIGDKAPEILGKDENGREIRLSDYKGKKLGSSPNRVGFIG